MKTTSTLLLLGSIAGALTTLTQSVQGQTAEVTEITEIDTETTVEVITDTTGTTETTSESTGESTSETSSENVFATTTDNGSSASSASSTSSSSSKKICKNDVVIDSSTCNAQNKTSCFERCGIHDTDSLLSKCCAYAGVSATILVYQESSHWEDRLNEFNKCTGSNIRVSYQQGGESTMPDALQADVGSSTHTGQGIYDAYVVRAPWMPPIYQGLKPLTTYIQQSASYIDFGDINEATREMVAFEDAEDEHEDHGEDVVRGEQIYALPFDSHYVSLSYRADVFALHAESYLEEYGEELKPPQTIEELVTISERLNGMDHNDDGVPDWGFCLSPQTNVFYTILAPIVQTHTMTCVENEDMWSSEGYDCSKGETTGQNLFFDVDTFEPLIHNDGYKLAFELYYRLLRSSNCQDSPTCDHMTDFSTGRCAGVLSLSDTMASLLLEDGEYTIQPRYNDDGSVWKPGMNLPEGDYWARRIIFPGSTMVLDHDDPSTPLVECTQENHAVCPLAQRPDRDAPLINYAPFFTQSGESYAINANAKPRATDSLFDLFTWFAELPFGLKVHQGIYRKSQLTDSFKDSIAEEWNDVEVLAEDTQDVLKFYFRGRDQGGNYAQDFRMLHYDDYEHTLDLEMHDFLIYKDVADGGLFDVNDPTKSVDPAQNRDMFDTRYAKFIQTLRTRYDDITFRADRGALSSLVQWRKNLRIQPNLDEEEYCTHLIAKDRSTFERLDCLNALGGSMQVLCSSQKDAVEEYSPGTCSEPEPDNTTRTIIILVSVLGGTAILIILYFMYNRMKKFRKIQLEHKQIMEATLNDSIRSLRQLDYPFNLIRGDEFISTKKLLRHEVLRNTHRVTVLDTLVDVDAFKEAGKNIVFISHQWTSFTDPDSSGAQYEAMCIALKELAKQMNWDESLKDVFVWVDYSCLPQANTSIQNLAVRSLAAYAASAQYFLIVAPETNHADLDELCDIDTYQNRVWTRAEQVCHAMKNGTEGMFVTHGKEMPLAPIQRDFFKESFRMFEGELTCCRLEHKGMALCDRQCLVIPLLGLYGELYRSSMEGRHSKGGALASVDAFLSEIENHQEEIFPATFERTTWRKNKQTSEEVVLFGDLIDRMRARVKGGGGFDVDDETGTASMSTMHGSQGSMHGAVSAIRHGAVAAVRHGTAMVGGGTRHGSVSVHQGVPVGANIQGQLRHGIRY